MEGDYKVALYQILRNSRRTYGLTYVLTLLPRLIPMVIKIIKSPSGTDFIKLRRLFYKHLSATFPRFILTLFGGFQLLELLFKVIGSFNDQIESSNEKESFELKQKPTVNLFKNQNHSDSNQDIVQYKFKGDNKWRTALAGSIASSAALMCLDINRRTDFVLFACVRAMDSWVSSNRNWFREQLPKIPEWCYRSVSTFVFQMSAFQIIYAWFYVPTALPQSYHKWITKLSRLDVRLFDMVRQIREGSLVMNDNTPIPDYLKQVCIDRGIEASKVAVMKGGLPCAAIHAGIENCAKHAAKAWIFGFLDALKIYLPLNVLAMFFRISSLNTKNFVPRLQRSLLSGTQSACFLGSFISMLWIGVCSCRRTFNPYDKWYGQFIGSWFCGFSILIEKYDRRRQLALYCLPKAFEAFLHMNVPTSIKRQCQPWVPGLEIAMFTCSMSYMFVQYRHHNEKVRPFIRSVFKFLISS
ncbi:hypothetical protein BC833DRAFT_623090 [Globomyces pollinis-pini]|nr:hypothetical protein BC833DRAFT_623090 [Globomyces pollinis-pini]